MRRRGWRRVPWVSLVLWAVAITAAVESTGVALGRWALTPTGQVLATSGLTVAAVSLWAALGARAEAEGRHSAARLAAVRAQVRAGVAGAIDRGEVEVPEELRADLDGPPYATPERRGRARPVPGGRRHDDPPARLPRRGGPRLCPAPDPTPPA